MLECLRLSCTKVQYIAGLSPVVGLPFSQQHAIGVLCWSPLASGFLTDGFDLDALDPGDFRRSHSLAREPRASLLKRVRAALMQIAHERQKTLAELAIAWVLRQPAVTGAI